MARTELAICRVCQHYCGVKVEVSDAGRIVRVTGDPDNPVYRGYTCQKGRAHAQLYDSPDRLLRPLKRMADGSLREIEIDQAIEEIGDKLTAIIAEHGPRSLALYHGFFGYLDHPANPSFMDAFMNAIGSKMMFSSASIDQPGKTLVKGLLGVWMAPSRGVNNPDVAMYVGANPLVSHHGLVGIPRDVHDVPEQGVIVIDPRRSETAAKARLHIQPRPGTDHLILAAIIRVILAEGLVDQEFIRENVQGLDALQGAVEPFTPELVGALAGVDPSDLVTAGRMFGGARRAFALAGTGANMAGHGTLVEYLVAVLHTICGQWMREGELITNDPAALPQYAVPAKAQAFPPFPAYGFGEPLRVRGFADTLIGYQLAALPDEILMPGEGQVRALLNIGGNPAAAMPNQRKVVDALKSLDLLVTTEVQMGATAQLADYVIPSTLPYEMPASTLFLDFTTMYGTGMGCMQPYAQMSRAVVEPPAGAQTLNNWQLLFRIARRMGLQLEVYPAYGSKVPGGWPTALDMGRMPTEDEVFDIIHAGSRVPWREVREAGRGLWPETCRVIAAKDPGWEGRLDVGNGEMLAELAETLATPVIDDEFPLRLTCRRMAEVVNTPTPARPAKSPPYNWLSMHPGDIGQHGLEDGGLVEVATSQARIVCLMRADASLREGVVTLTHQFGGIPGEQHDLERDGASVNALISDEVDYDRMSGQPLMSNLAVRVSPVAMAG